MKKLSVIFVVAVLAVAAFAQTKPEEEVAAARQYAEECKSGYGKYSAEYVNALVKLTSAYLSDDDIKGSLSTALEAYSIADSLGYENETSTLAASAGYGYKWLAGRCGNEYGKARDLYAKSILYFTIAGDGYNDQLKAVNLKLAATYCHEADDEYQKGNYEKAVEISAGIALPMVESIASRNSEEYTVAAGNLALYYDAAGNYGKAIETGTLVLEIEKELSGGMPNAYIAESLNNLSTFHSSAGNIEEAIMTATLAVEMQEEVAGNNNIDYATYCSTLALAYSYAGDYDRALELENASMSIIAGIEGENCYDYALSLVNYASFNESKGNYTDAVRYAGKATEIMAAAVGYGHPDYLRCRRILASAYGSTGNNRKALAIEKDLCRKMENVLGKSHPDYILSLNNIASCYSSLQENDSALIVGKKVVELMDSIHGKNHPDYITALNNLAGYYEDRHDYDRAIDAGKEVLELCRQNYGENYPGYALALNNMCTYELWSGNAREAAVYGEKAVAAMENIYGKNHPDYTTSLENLIAAYYFSVDYANCEKHIREIVGNRNKEIIRNFGSMTSAERAMFWNRYKEWYESFLPNYAFGIGSDSLRIAAYDGILLSKGLLLNSDIEMRKLITESGDTAALHILDRMSRNRRILNSEYDKPATSRTVDTDSLAAVMEKLESQLVERSKEYGDYTRNLAISWKDVENQLSDGDIAIEFLLFDTQDETQYVALTLKKGYESPKMTPLFNSGQLENIDINLYYSSPLLYSLVWRPLEKEMENTKRVYFAPSGELYNIAIESVLAPDLSLISDKRDYYRLSSTRQLAIDHAKVADEQAAVYGGLHYSTGIGTLDRDSRNYGLGKRAIRLDTSVLGLRGNIQDLPGTEIEAEEICSSLKSAKIETKMFIDTLGTEASLKSLSGKGINILHIATHGFYWTKSEAAVMGRFSFLTGNSAPRAAEDKALTQSGLLFAGANNALRGKELPDGVDDGILTAQEIASLDFGKMNLVALSACQTGLGEITGEGVFGLQRGFKKAGARTLLMSLWKVDDDATRLLMTEFYKNMLSGKSKYESLKDAQRYVREYTVTIEDNYDNRPAISAMAREEARKREKEGKKYKTIQKYRDPYYWAGFILLDAL